MPLTFASYFGTTAETLDSYGAFNISLESDLPVFVDPFLLFNSDKQEYQQLHNQIIDYLSYLRKLSAAGQVDDGTLRNLYCFKEVKQNWLGFTFMGNGGSGLGIEFASALNSGLHDLFADFGEETITNGSHLEKVALIRRGVGRDNMSDFATNLIKEFLLEYTQEFARKHIDERLLSTFRVSKVRFNYDTESWMERTFLLPLFIRNTKRDFVILTPSDILTRDQLWINGAELYRQFERLPESISDLELRSRINSYFNQALGNRRRKEDRYEAIEKTLKKFPELIDYYIRMREEQGEDAASDSLLKVKQAEGIARLKAAAASSELARTSNFYRVAFNSYEDALQRAKYFKQYIENQDGYRLLNNSDGILATEKDVQLFFGLVWFGSPNDVNREVNNGRGPVDFKVSFGNADKSLIEMKLGSNTKLKRNLEKQLEVYEAANQTNSSVKIIICYTASDQQRVRRILRELDMLNHEAIIVIDARRDNKPSGSKA